MKRVVNPEILDELAVDDPRAIRSRRDLRLINALMGNERWIKRQLLKDAPGKAFSELGAGRGELLTCLGRSGGLCRGYDLQPRPESLFEKVDWVEGDFFEALAGDESEVVGGSLILHHFEEEALLRLGRLLAGKKMLVFAEPLRSPLALAEGYFLFPLVNGVTRHDMMVSIRAGFLKGELAAKLGLEKGWQWRESVTARGGLRSVGLRVD